jgi:hypothetical protein
MIPFRVYDRDKKITWVVLNYHEAAQGGQYLVARNDDSKEDGQISTLTVEQMKSLRLLDFCDEHE